MRTLFIMAIAWNLIISSNAQNVGVGITTPRSRLHVFTGASGNNTPFSPLVVESNTNTYINLLSPEANETSILFGKPSNAASGGVMYNAANTPNGFQFRTNGNTTKVVISDLGNLGIGIGETTPIATLDVARGTAINGTAVFRGTNNLTHFNYGTDEDTYIRAGKNNRFVILNDIPGGRVGIGTNSPNAPLGFPAVLGKKITLYPGGTGDIGFGVQGSLFQIYADNPNTDIAFGYDQTGTFNERFRMKGNGAFVVNGNLGSPGQVLQTNGNAAPTWTNPTNLLYSNTIKLDVTAGLTLTNSNWTPIPGLSYTFTANSNTKVLVSFSIFAQAGFCFGCGSTSTYIDLKLDGAMSERFIQTIGNGDYNTISGTALLQMGSGSHTISFEGSAIGNAIYLGDTFLASHAILQIIPQ
jgi:hypothetical protein